MILKQSEDDLDFYLKVHPWASFQESEAVEWKPTLNGSNRQIRERQSQCASILNSNTGS